MKYFTNVAPAKLRTSIVGAAVVIFDTLFFRRKLKRQLQLIHADAQSRLMVIRDFQKILQDHERDEARARAQLMQLRVHQESVRGRTGFMVSAFVPDSVLATLRRSPRRAHEAFRDRIAKVLVERALEGLFRVSSQGRMVAMIFEPLGATSDKRIVSPVFETDEAGHKVVHTSPDLRQIQEGESQ